MGKTKAKPIVLDAKNVGKLREVMRAQTEERNAGFLHAIDNPPEHIKKEFGKKLLAEVKQKAHEMFDKKSEPLHLPPKGPVPKDWLEREVFDLETLFTLKEGDVVELPSLMGGLTKENVIAMCMKQEANSTTLRLMWWGIKLCNATLVRSKKGELKWA